MKKYNKNGFSIELKNEQFTVSFKEYNNIITYCTINFDLPDFDIWDLSVIGVAKVAKEDVYEKDTGRVIAYEKAYDKMVDKYEREFNNYLQKHYKKMSYITNSLNKRFDKFINIGR